MTNRLPPLKTLPAFCAVAKHKSFTKAAQELSVTHSAISQSIKILEDFIGHPLLSRTTSSVELTKYGEVFYTEISNALNIIHTATKWQKSTNSYLTINVPDYFAVRWLIPRLPKFQELYPNLNLRLATLKGKVSPIDFAAHHFDLAIDYGGANDWPDCITDKLFSDSLVLVAGWEAKYNYKNMSTKEIFSLAKAIFISNKAHKKDWETWCKQAKILPPNPESRIYFQNIFEALQAIHEDNRIMVTQKSLVQDELTMKRLILLSDITAKTNNQFYLIYPRNNINKTGIRLVNEWLQTEKPAM